MEIRKGKFMRKFWVRAAAVTMAVTLAFTNTAFADNWYQQGDNWFVRKDSDAAQGGATEYRTGWYQDEKGDWYYLEPSPDSPIQGALKSGWLLEGENWYFLNTVHDGYYGRRLVNTWQWIDGYCYCFDETGKLIVNGMTPDQYMVNQDGQWIVDGIVQYIPGKGILTKISQASSGGHSGGGSGGSGGGSSSSSGGGSSNGSGNGTSSGSGSGDSDNSGGNTSDSEEEKPSDAVDVTVTVVYQDADTNEILGTEKLNGKPGAKTQINHREFGGYTILDGQPIEAVFANKDTEVYVLYRKTLFNGNIVIQYVDVDQSSLIATKTVSGLVGEEYIVHIPAIEGYKAVAGQEDFTVVFREEQQTAKVEYRLIQTGEEMDQTLVMADNVKVAQADNAEEKVVLNQIYDGIFDYQQYEDGTIELAVYNGNPILQYALDGEYKANDVIYIEPTEDFAAGLTFIYQSHDDNYSGEFEGYDAGQCEVIRGYQASPFALFAPGTNVEIEITNLTSGDVESQMEWSLFGNDKQESSVNLVRRAARNGGGSWETGATDYSIINIPIEKAEIDKEKLKKVLPQAGKDFIDKYVNSFENEVSASMSAKNFILKIYIPFADNNTGIFVNDKIYEFQMSPTITVTNETTITFGREGSAEANGEELVQMINEELSTVPIQGLSEQEEKTKRENAVKLGNFWVQGIDLEDQGMFPFAAQGINLVTKQFSTKVSDLIASDGDKAVSLKSIKVYIGLIECMVFKIDGSAQVTNTLSASATDFTMGVRYTEENGSYRFENLTTVPTFTVGDEFSCKVGVDGKVGLCVMAVASVGGVVPVGIGPEFGLKFEEAYAELTASLEADTKGKMEWDAAATFDGNLAVYGNLDFHSRMAVGFGDAEDPMIELLPIDETIISREWPLDSVESDETSIQVRDENDIFQLCDADGKDLNTTVSPIKDGSTGGWSFDCPEYILKEVDGKKKKCTVTKLTILPSASGETAFWTQLKLPDTVTELSISAAVSEGFLCDYPETLQKLSFTGAGSELSSLDVSKVKGLQSLNISGTAITSLDVSANPALTSVIINLGLLEFTGNGHTMPDKLTWFSDPGKTMRVNGCGSGQTIYSGPYEEEVSYDQGALSINDPATAAYWVLDEYGNDISSTWPGYNEETGMVSPVFDEATGKYSIKVPQYIRIKDGTDEKTLDVRDFYYAVMNGVQYSVIDCSEAPSIKVLSSSTDYTGSAPETIILPQELLQMSCVIPDGGEFECDFSAAPDLYRVHLTWGGSKEGPLRNLDFSANYKLEEVGITVRNSSLNLQLPDTDTLKEIKIQRGSKGEDNVREIDFSRYPNLTSLYLDYAGISAIDLSGLESLESLTLANMPIEELDLTNNPQLSELSILGLNMRHLDISQNELLTSLNVGTITNYQKLYTFTGNGLVIPAHPNWYTEEEYKDPIDSCGPGETIYSAIYWQNQPSTALAMMMLEEPKDIIDEEQKELDEEVADEDTAGEDTIDEDIADEDIAGEDIIDEDIADEDIIDEDIVDEDIEDEDAVSKDITDEDTVDEGAAENGPVKEESGNLAEEDKEESEEEKTGKLDEEDVVDLEEEEKRKHLEEMEELSEEVLEKLPEEKSEEAAE